MSKRKKQPPPAPTFTAGPWFTDGAVVWCARMGAVACTRVPLMTCPRCGHAEHLRPQMPGGGTLAPIESDVEAAGNARRIAAVPKLVAVVEQLEERLTAIGAHEDWLLDLRAALEDLRR